MVKYGSFWKKHLTYALIQVGLGELSKISIIFLFKTKKCS